LPKENHTVSIDWTPEQREVFARLSRMGAAGRRAAARARIDKEYPDLPEEERARLAEVSYRLEMSAQARAQWRRQRRRTKRTA
jgi:hypothetical protein